MSAMRSLVAIPAPDSSCGLMRLEVGHDGDTATVIPSHSGDLLADVEHHLIASTAFLARVLLSVSGHLSVRFSRTVPVAR